MMTSAAMKRMTGGTEAITRTDEEWMTIALEEAWQAAEEDEVPVGAVAVLGDELVSRDHNRSIQINDPTAHAEILVLRKAAHELENYRLPGLRLYVTLEPCSMCAGALVWARIDCLLFGARDEKSGAVVSKTQLLSPGLFNHDVRVNEGILQDLCRFPLRRFFAEKRKRSGLLPAAIGCK